MVLTPAKKEELVHDILRCTHESIDLVELGTRVLPKMDHLFDTSTSIVYQANNAREIVPVAGQLSESLPYYARYYLASDPLQKTICSTNPRVVIGSTMANWAEYLASATFNECIKRTNMHNFLHIRVTQCGMYDPGMVGLLLGRTFRQADFSDQDLSLLKKVLPALEALVRRHDRLDKRSKVHCCVETLMEYAPKATIILDLKGAFIWAAERAETLLHISSNGCKRVPKELQVAAKRLGAFLDRPTNTNPPPISLSVPRNNEKPLKGEMRLVRNRKGSYFALVELQDSGDSPQLALTAATYRLTPTEREVLQLIAMGLNDQEIGRRLFISFTTVRSHVSHILAKLDVKSRTQAALIAHGHKVPGL